MATSTERFGFTLPSGQDPASIIPLNLNTQNIEKYLGMTQDMLAPLYDATEGTYEVDDIVTYDSILYKCITAIATPEAFDETKWTPTTAVSEGGSGAGAIEKIQSEYDALTPAQKTNGTIYMVQSEGEETRTSLDMTNITTYRESSMSVSTSISETEVSWNGGTTIGCTSFYTNPIDVTDIDYITYELETGSCYGNGSEAQQERWRFDVGYASTAPSGMGNQELFDEYNEHKYSNTVYTADKCVLDVRNVTGNVYIIINSHGWNATLSNIELVSVSSESVNKIYYMGTEYANTNGGGGGTSEGEGVEIYSESEYIVGKWIDGKKVYQKTYYVASIDQNPSDWVTLFADTDIETLLDYEYELTAQNGQKQSSQMYFGIQMYGDDVRYYANMGNGTATDLYLTLRYTKTVETPAPAWGGSVTNNYAGFIDVDNVIYSTTSSSTTDTYTATEDCYIMQDIVTGSTVSTVNVDGETVAEYLVSGTQIISYNAFLKKGQVLTVTHGGTAQHTIKVFGITYASGGSETPATDASEVEYDNTTSQLTADNVQEAIDEVVANADTAFEDILTLQNVQGYDEYDETQTYAVGDYAIYNNIVYECTTAVSTAEPFDSTKWTATSIEQIIDGVKGDVSSLNSSLSNYMNLFSNTSDGDNLSTITKTGFWNITNATNPPTGSAGNGYYIGLARADAPTSRMLQFWVPMNASNTIYFRAFGNGQWTQLA